jgi:hypothetical protein
LLAMKKAEREKQLEEVEQKQMKSRPKSARAARLVKRPEPWGKANVSNAISPMPFYLTREN